MTKSNRSSANKLLVLIAALALFATACAGGGISDEGLAAIATAEATETQLQLTSDLSATQFLDTENGEIAALTDIITGDRPVLLWYWAPH